MNRSEQETPPPLLSRLRQYATLRHLPLGVVLPLALSLALLVMLAANVLSAKPRFEATLRESTANHLRSVAYGLVLEAEDERHTSDQSDGDDDDQPPDQDPGTSNRLWLHTAQVWTDPRISAVAVIGPDGRIVAAHQLAWRGRPAAQLLPSYDPIRPGRLDPVTHHQVQWSADARHARLQISYLVPNGGSRPRHMQRGSVYVEADLSDELADVLRQTLLARRTDLLISVVLLGLLVWWLRWQVTRPLAALERTSHHLANDDMTARAPEAGPQEIARLAHSFNQMADALQNAQAELHASEERLSTILYSTGDALLVTDTAQRITLLNRTAEQLTGWTEGEAIGRPVAQVFRIEHAETGRPAEIPVARVLADGQAAILASQTVLVSRTGRRHHIADSAAPVRRGSGQIAGVVLVFRDVSAAQQLERALADRERHYRTLADSGRALIWTTDRDGRNTWCNALWRTFTGQDEAASQGQGWLAAVHPDDVGRLRATSRSARTYQEPWSLELRLRRTDGSYRWMLCDAAPQHDSTGRYSGHIGQCLDITAQRDSQATLQEQLAELRRLQVAMLGREGRIAALKQEVNELLRQAGAPPRYAHTHQSASNDATIQDAGTP